MINKAYVHIGKHKTGTTSFQKYLADHIQRLHQHGVLYVPTGISDYIVSSVVRDQLEIPPMTPIRKAGATPSIESACAKLRKFVSDKKFEVLLFSCEHFSYLREQAEIDALNYILWNTAQITPGDVSVFLTIRDPGEFLESYKKQTIKTGYKFSNDEKSPYYCEPDSWLLDDDKIKALWGSNYSAIDVLNYESGDMVSQLCKSMDLPNLGETKQYQLNRTKGKINILTRRFLPKPLLKLVMDLRNKLLLRKR